MNHKCKAPQVFIEVYDETMENAEVHPKNGDITGMILCKTRCTACGEIYLDKVPFLKFSKDEELKQESDEDYKDSSSDDPEDEEDDDGEGFEGEWN